MNSTNDFELINTNEQYLANYNSNLDKMISNLDIKSLTSSIVQIPSSDNEYHGVATAKLTTSNGEEFTGFGEAYADEHTPKNMVLRYADMFAKTDACVTASISLVRRNSDASKTNYQATSNQNNFVSKSSHSTYRSHKPISEGQIKYIDGLAKKVNKTGDSIAKERFNTSIDALNYIQAKTLIDEMKK